MIKEVCRLAIVFLCCVVSGCTDTPTVRKVVPNCFGPVVEITTSLSEKNIDLAQQSGFQEQQPAAGLRSKGVFIAKNQVLTVAHAVPETTDADGYVVSKRDKNQHLLLLTSVDCGNPLPLAAISLGLGDDVFDCISHAKAGSITGVENSVVADSPFSSTTVMLQGLAVLPGTYAPGDSGMPFCDEQGRLTSILVSIRDGAALLIPIQQIRSFLN